MFHKVLINWDFQALGFEENTPKEKKKISTKCEENVLLMSGGLGEMGSLVGDSAEVV